MHINSVPGSTANIWDKEYCLWSVLLEQMELPMLKCEERQQQEFHFIVTEYTVAEG